MSGFEVLNPGQFRMAMESNKNQLSRNITAINKKTALGIKTDAMMNTPVRKGKLRKGWSVTTVSPWEYVVHNEVDYGPAVEFGYTQTRTYEMQVAMFASGNADKGKAREGQGLKKGETKTVQVQGRHMLAKACAKWAPIRRYQITAAIGKVCKG